MHQSKGGQNKTNPSIFNNPLQQLCISHLCTHGWQNDRGRGKTPQASCAPSRRLPGRGGVSGAWCWAGTGTEPWSPGTEMCLALPAPWAGTAVGAGPARALCPSPRRTEQGTLLETARQGLGMGNHSPGVQPALPSAALKAEPCPPKPLRTKGGAELTRKFRAPPNPKLLFPSFKNRHKFPFLPTSQGSSED